MVIKIVGEEQVVCDCEGDIPELWLKRLFVRITEHEDSVAVTVVCVECDSSMRYEVKSNLILKALPDY